MRRVVGTEAIAVAREGRASVRPVRVGVELDRVLKTERSESRHCELNRRGALTRKRWRSGFAIAGKSAIADGDHGTLCPCSTRQISIAPP